MTTQPTPYPAADLFISSFRYRWLDIAFVSTAVRAKFNIGLWMRLVPRLEMVKESFCFSARGGRPVRYGIQVQYEVACPPTSKRWL